MKATIEKENVKIPIEIMLDVCKMIYNGELQNQIMGLNEVRGEIILEIKYRKENKIQQAAMNNIFNSLYEWNEERYGEEDPEDVLLT